MAGSVEVLRASDFPRKGWQTATSARQRVFGVVRRRKRPTRRLRRSGSASSTRLCLSSTSPVAPARTWHRYSFFGAAPESRVHATRGVKPCTVILPVAQLAADIIIGFARIRMRTIFFRMSWTTGLPVSDSGYRWVTLATMRRWRTGSIEVLMIYWTRKVSGRGSVTKRGCWALIDVNYTIGAHIPLRRSGHSATVCNVSAKSTMRASTGLPARVTKGQTAATCRWWIRLAAPHRPIA